MPLTDQQQFEVAVRAVMQGLIGSDHLLSALDDWRQSRSSGSSLQNILLDTCSFSEEHRQKLSQLFIEAESDHASLGSHGIARLKQLLQEEPQAELGGSDSSPSRLTASWQAELPADVSGTGTVTFDSQITRLFTGSGKASRANAAVGPQDSSQLNDAHRFRLLDQVAQGGLGEIYLADDRQLNRTVAVKKIRQKHCDLPIAREKFTLEAEVTGQLEHPGIVPVYALGIDAKGQPYYAMRFITGQNMADRIADFHQQFQSQIQPFDSLALRQLLRRFLDVCNALEYAHSRGVVHRDLKPANIMVGEHGETLVVDWGLAKVMSNAGQTESIARTDKSLARAGLRLSGTTDMTRLGSFLGTLRYAPPEQLMGLIDEIDASSDVYSLGAILYEILTGTAPLDGTYRDPLDVCLVLREGKLPAARELNPQTPRGLDAVCRKAMAASKQDRYASARDLALDVERWLADECVQAYGGKEPLPERAGRWLRKHRSWTFAIGTSLVLVTIVAILAVTVINQARFSERIARNNADQFKSDAVSRYRAAKSAIDSLVERSEALKDYPYSAGLQKQLLEEAASVFQSLGESVSQDPELQIERIRSMVRLGDVYHMIRSVTPDPALYDPYPQYETALEIARTALQTQLPTQLSAIRSPAMILALKIEIARTLSRIALARDADGLVDLARNAYDQAVEQFSDLSDKHPESVEVAGNLAIALSNQASMEDHLGAHASAVQLLEQALTQFDKRDVQSHPMFALPAARAREAYARALRSVGRHSESAVQLEKVEAAVADLLNREPKNWRYREAQGSLLISAAANCQLFGDYETALSTLLKASEAYDRLRRERPDSFDYNRSYALTRLNSGLVRLELGEFAKAEDDLRQAVELTTQLVDAYSWLGNLRLEQAKAVDAYAEALSLQKPEPSRLPEIESLFEQSQQMVENLIASLNETKPSMDSHVYRAALARFQSHHAEHLSRNGNSHLAREQFDKALVTLELIVKQDGRSSQARSDLAYAGWTAGLFLHQQQEAERSRELFQKAAELWRSLLVDDATPLHQYHLARLLRDCPIADLRDTAQSEVLLRLAQQAVPNIASRWR